jgi:hypothetical protein
MLCRTWCNPAPADGSQPDLILAETDSQGVIWLTQAFNTKTSEQSNAWLNGFEAQMWQMTEITFNFFMHAILLIYKDAVYLRVHTKGQDQLDDDSSEGDRMQMDDDGGVGDNSAQT